MPLLALACRRCAVSATLKDAAPILVNGTELTVLESGQGDPLVLVHGGVSDLRTWHNQIGVFAETFRTICYSRRYHVPNIPIPPNAADPVQTHVDDLAQLIETLEAAPAHIVGHSWGGLITLMLARQRPNFCRSLVLIEPPVVSMYVRIPPKFVELIGLFLRSPRLAFAIMKLGAGALSPAEKAFRRGDDNAAIEHFGRGVLGDLAYERLSAERRRQVWANRGPDRAQALHHSFPDLIRESFTSVTLPVLLVSGAQSPPLFGMLNDGLVKRLPNARRCVISGASHIVHEDSPDDLNSAILKFLYEVR
jgi:pimeloyl-ACP methyl ester carboxylesterase